MAEQKRADYASTRPQASGAWVAAVEEGSPAWEAGIEPGMRIDSVNGVKPRDIIDWRWEADGGVCDLVVFDPRDGTSTPCQLWREPGEDWGIDFTDVLFDGIRTCVNACQFCFMAMLPPEARATLTLRDDDYRLSFLQGNFVTLTNVSDEEAERIVTCGLSPMNVSIHVITPEVRRGLIGRRADRGIEVLERLLAGGIEVHAQIVLCPGINDGDELTATLDWVEARPGITSLAIVPLGYTKHSRRFQRSYSDDPAAAREVVRALEQAHRRMVAVPHREAAGLVAALGVEARAMGRVRPGDADQAVLGHLADLAVAAEHADAPMAALPQVVDDARRRLLVVGREGREALEPPVVGGVGEEHARGADLAEALLEVAGVPAQEEEPLGVPDPVEMDGSRHLVGVLVDEVDAGLLVGLREEALGLLDDVVEEQVLHALDHDGKRGPVPRLEVARIGVGLVAHLADHLEDALARAVADAGVVVEHAGDGAQAVSGESSDVPDVHDAPSRPSP